MSTEIILQTTFPGALWIDRPVAERVEMAGAYCSALWADRDGWAAFGIGTGQHITKTGSYKFAPGNGFVGRFLRWPDEKARLAELVAAADAGADVYVAPMLRATRERAKGTGAGSRFAWADVDGPLTAERVAVLQTFVPLVRIVSSGGGHHVYVELDDWHDVEAVEAANKGLVAALAADAKWSDESLLRLPGTWNYKAPTRGTGDRALVQLMVEVPV